MNHWRGISEDGQTITLKKFKANFETFESQNTLAMGAVIDVEATGLDLKNDRVIEIAIRTFQFDTQTGRLASIHETYSAFQDPGQPLREEIIEITGITDADLKDQKIDWAHVQNILESCKIIIAHNAAYDRPLVEKELSTPMNLLWACSLKQIDWRAKGLGVQKLDILCAYHGFFTDAHRALNDVNSLLYLLTFADARTDRFYLAELFENAHRAQTKVLATRAPFETKDILRVRGYRWDAAQRVWNRVLYQDNVETEKLWLEKEVYKGAFLGKLEPLNLLEQFRQQES